MSLKCMIDKWLHKGQISQEEYDAVIKKLDGHDAEIKGQIIREVLEIAKEQNEIYLAEREKQIRADAERGRKMELIKEYGGADFLDLRALNVFAQFCFEKGREQGRLDAEQELNALGECEYNKGAEDFSKWLATKRGFSKEWVEWHIEHWKKEREDNEN